MSFATFTESATPSTPSTGKAKLFVPVSSVPTLAILDDAGAVGVIAFSAAGTLTYTPPTSWTIGVSFGGGTTGITYSAQVASYERHGKRILYSGYFRLSAKGSSTGTALITGLPVASRTLTNFFQTVALYGDDLATITGHLQGHIASNSQTISLSYLGTGSSTALTDANFGNTSLLMVQGSYEVA
jgi:hypothetical protein